MIHLKIMSRKRRDFLYYRPQRSWGKVMFLQASVILLTRGGGSASVHAGIPQPPWSRHPPGADPPEHTPSWEQTPPEQTPPWEHTAPHPPEQTPPKQTPPPPTPVQSMLGDTVNVRAVRILLECNLVFFVTSPKTFL